MRAVLPHGLRPVAPRRRRGFGRASGGVLARAGGTLLLLTLLSACASTFAELPTAVGGLPEGTPERPAAPAAYPAVHDMPPQRTGAVLSEEDAKKAAAELTAARERQNKRATAAARNQ